MRTVSTWYGAASVFFQAGIQAFFLAAVLMWSKGTPWHVASAPGTMKPVMSSPNTMLFMFSLFQFLIIATVFNIARPFRRPMYKNGAFLDC